MPELTSPVLVGAKPAPVSLGQPSERRTEPRWRLRRPRQVRLLIRPSFAGCLAWLQEVSLQGLGLVTEEPCAAGTILAVLLPRRHAGCVGVLTAAVRHATPLLDGVWLVGCSLARALTDEETHALLQPGPQPPRA